MQEIRHVIVSCSLTIFLGGCVFPGSGIGHLSVQGSLTTDQNDPLPNRQVEFLLPASYGFGGHDLVLNKPQDFGHQDQRFRVSTDSNGEFSHDLGEHIYHMSVWLLPPLGGFPRHPPAPVLLVRVPGFPGEYYAVQTHDGAFKVYMEVGDELTLLQAKLSQLEASHESGSTDGRPWTRGILHLQFPMPD